jgi:hypothetical protein
MPEQTTETLLESIWGEKEKKEDKNLLKLGLTLIEEGPFITFTHDDIEYICNYRYPYLQLANSEAHLTKDRTLQFLLLPNHWVIYDYGDMLCTAVSHFYREKTEEEGGEGQGGSEGGAGGFGTLVFQQFQAVLAMIREAIAKGWGGIEIIAGTKLMQSFAWVAGQELGIEIMDYSPNSDDLRRYKLISREREIARTLEMQKEAVVHD